MKCSRCGGMVDNDFPSRCLTEGCKEVMCDNCSIKHDFRCTSHSVKKKRVVLEEIRRSHIELYKKCPRAFELQVVENKEVQSGIYADIGIRLHTIFDMTSKSNEMDVEAMKAQYTVFFKSLLYKQFEGCQRKLTIHEFMHQQHEKGMKNIEGYQILCGNMPAPWKTEERISIDIPGSTIKATIAYDRINKNANGTYDLLDYKTGKVHVGQKLNDDLQPALYIACVEKNYDIRINRFIFLFTGECKERIFERIDDDRFECMVGKKSYGFSISEKIKEISLLFKSIESGDFPIPSELHPYTCENECGSYKNGDCSGKFNGQWKGVK
jgi:hypothetical protein